MTRTRKAPTVRLSAAQCHAVLMLMQESDSIWNDPAADVMGETLAHGSAFGGASIGEAELRFVADYVETDPETWSPRTWRSLQTALAKV